MTRFRAVVALGMFDGVHMGHRRLLQEAVRMAKELDATPVAFTFANSPQALFGTAPPMLTLPEEKRQLIEGLGLYADITPFTKQLASQSPRDFVEALNNRYKVVGLVAGFNFRYGSHRAGGSESLRAYGREKGIAVSILEPVTLYGEPVSSTRIRAAVLAGNLELANELLTEPFFYKGRVTPRRQLGHKLGFPTANLLPEGKILPPFGVYVAEALLDEGLFPAVANVGVRPTVDAAGVPTVTVEPYLLGYAGDLYGREMTLRLLSFTRPEKKFSSLEALSKQIGQDVENAKAFFENRTKQSEK